MYKINCWVHKEQWLLPTLINMQNTGQYLPKLPLPINALPLNLQCREYHLIDDIAHSTILYKKINGSLKTGEELFAENNSFSFSLKTWCGSCNGL